jgi:hypothetical protein
MRRYKKAQPKSGRGGKGGKVQKQESKHIAIGLSKARTKGKKVPKKRTILAQCGGEDGNKDLNPHHTPAKASNSTPSFRSDAHILMMQNLTDSMIGWAAMCPAGRCVQEARVTLSLEYERKVAARLPINTDAFTTNS